MELLSSSSSSSKRGGGGFTITFTSSNKRKNHQRSPTTSPTSSSSFRSDLDGGLEVQKVNLSKIKKSKLEAWAYELHNDTLLTPQDLAWCGKALISEAINYQYKNKSKKLTKAFLAKVPLMAHYQRRFEDDFVFDLEEELGMALNSDIIIAPMAPELCSVIYNDIECMIGVKQLMMLPAEEFQSSQSLNGSMEKEILVLEAVPEFSVAFNTIGAVSSAVAIPIASLPLKYQVNSGITLRSLVEGKKRYVNAINHFSQLNLWRLSSVDKKKKKRNMM